MAITATLGLIAEEYFLPIVNEKGEHRVRVLDTQYIYNLDAIRVTTHCETCNQYGVVEIGFTAIMAREHNLQEIVAELGSNLRQCWSMPCKLWETWAQFKAWLGLKGAF